MRDRYGSAVRPGGYGGFLRLAFPTRKGGETSSSLVAYYYHGTGGGAPVTLGTIEKARIRDRVDADLYLLGHIHQKTMVETSRHFLNGRDVVTERRITGLRMGALKRDVGVDGARGWAVERGIGPRPLNGWWIRFFLRPRVRGQAQAKGYVVDYEPTPVVV